MKPCVKRFHFKKSDSYDIEESFFSAEVNCFMTMGYFHDIEFELFYTKPNEIILKINEKNIDSQTDKVLTNEDSNIKYIIHYSSFIGAYRSDDIIYIEYYYFSPGYRDYEFVNITIYVKYLETVGVDLMFKMSKNRHSFPDKLGLLYPIKMKKLLDYQKNIDKDKHKDNCNLKMINYYETTSSFFPTNGEEYNTCF